MRDRHLHFENSTPILNVADLDKSIQYYVDMLGFSLDWRQNTMASVSRDAAHIMLCEHCQGCSGTWVWIGVSNAAALYDEYKQKDVEILMAPTNFPWAYEMRIPDIDGHILRLGSDPLS